MNKDRIPIDLQPLKCGIIIFVTEQLFQYKQPIMRNLVKIVLLSLLVGLTFQCCTSKNQRSRRPVSAVSLYPNARNYILGQPLEIRVSTNTHGGDLESVHLYLNSELLLTSDQTDFSFAIDALHQLGDNVVRVTSRKTDGIENTRLLNFKVLSNKVPEVYRFNILRDYPHNNLHFTQGLEFHNNHLYEGTGEYGKSGIYKSDYVSGNVLLEKKLPESYFGEGITILNNKLYQLTYKEQTGFVYNLSDFALIDSFKFASKEGWGLTNDGTHLIMSDGTAFLTWINPITYEIEKQVQVADHQRVWQYINELEYVDGSIWANVWTTNQIVRIDAETGQILGSVDLEGILSIMHQNQNQRIDVLNGIAYNKRTSTFFITGKLWPKIFEIEIEN